MKPQEMRGKTMQGADLGFFHLLKGRLRSFADLFSREMVSGPESGDQVLRSARSGEGAAPAAAASFPWPLCL